MSYEFHDRVPTPDEHRALSDSVGWTDAFAWDAIPASLAASFCGVVVTEPDTGTVVGMGRVIGDGAFYFYVQDVVVHPEHQGRGLGREIVGRLVGAVDASAPPKAFIGLFAAGSSAPFYAEHGFAKHAGMTGMFRVVPEHDADAPAPTLDAPGDTPAS
jgi:GNAT superfamily N-acetyltransferase